jgi:hypothetical protein
VSKPRAALKPRRAPDPAAVDAFVSGQPAPKPARSRREGRAVLVRKDGRQVRRTTIYMEVELAKRVGIHAVERGIDQTQIIQEALEEYLGKRKA